jgi:hypothetical protein
MEHLLFRYFGNLTDQPQGQPNDAEWEVQIFKQQFAARSSDFPVGDKTGACRRDDNLTKIVFVVTAVSATDAVTDRLTSPLCTKQARYWHDACPATRHDRNGPATCPACYSFKHSD